MTMAAPTAGAKLVYQKHQIACLPKQFPEALAFHRFFELAVLLLVKISNGEDRFLWRTKKLCEPFDEPCLRDLAAHIAAQLQLAKDILLIERL